MPLCRADSGGPASCRNPLVDYDSHTSARVLRTGRVFRKAGEAISCQGQGVIVCPCIPLAVKNPDSAPRVRRPQGGPQMAVSIFMGSRYMKVDIIEILQAAPEGVWVPRSPLPLRPRKPRAGQPGAGSVHPRVGIGVNAGGHPQRLSLIIFFILLFALRRM